MIHCDVANAFNSQNRYAFLEQVRKYCPGILHLAAQFYMEDTPLLLYMASPAPRQATTRTASTPCPDSSRATRSDPSSSA